MPEFDKNAAYIWTCYLIGLILIGSAVLQTVLAARSARRSLARMSGNEQDGAG